MEQISSFSGISIGDTVARVGYGTGVVRHIKRSVLDTEHPERTMVIGVEWDERRPEYHNLCGSISSNSGWYVFAEDLMVVDRYDGVDNLDDIDVDESALEGFMKFAGLVK